MNQEHGFALATEKLLNITVPERAQYIRVIFLELSRILNHLLNITTFALDIGAITPSLWAFEQREILMEFYERVSGARLHANYIRPGGVLMDVPDGMLDDIWEYTETFPDFMSDLSGLLTGNRIFKQRTVDIGIVTPDDAIAWGFSGPMLRASGIAWDLRKSQPYELYDELDFDVPIGKSGDCYARYLVRMAEMTESNKLIRQCLERIKPGAVKTDDYKIVPPPRAEMKHSMEALINHFKLYTLRAITCPPAKPTPLSKRQRANSVCIWCPTAPTNLIAATSAPRVSRTSRHLDAMSRGHMLADTVAIIGSLDVVFGEIDR